MGQCNFLQFTCRKWDMIMHREKHNAISAQPVELEINDEYHPECTVGSVWHDSLMCHKARLVADPLRLPRTWRHDCASQCRFCCNIKPSLGFAQLRGATTHGVVDELCKQCRSTSKAECCDKRIASIGAITSIVHGLKCMRPLVGVLPPRNLVDVADQQRSCCWSVM